MSDDMRRAVLRQQLRPVMLDLVITLRFAPREIIAGLVEQMAWLRQLPGGEPEE